MPGIEHQAGPWDHRGFVDDDGGCARLFAALEPQGEVLGLSQLWRIKNWWIVKASRTLPSSRLVDPSGAHEPSPVGAEAGLGACRPTLPALSGRPFSTEFCRSALPHRTLKRLSYSFARASAFSFCLFFHFRRQLGAGLVNSSNSNFSQLQPALGAGFWPLCAGAFDC